MSASTAVNMPGSGASWGTMDQTQACACAGCGARVVWGAGSSRSSPPRVQGVQATSPTTARAEIVRTLGASGASMAGELGEPGEPGGFFLEQVAGKLRELVMQPVVGPRTTGLQGLMTPATDFARTRPA